MKRFSFTNDASDPQLTMTPDARAVCDGTPLSDPPILAEIDGRADLIFRSRGSPPGQEASSWHEAEIQLVVERRRLRCMRRPGADAGADAALSHWVRQEFGVASARREASPAAGALSSDILPPDQPTTTQGARP